MKIVSPDRFGQLMSDYADAVNESYAATVKAAVFSWFKGVIMRTPVDTGRMRGNWLTSAGTPNYSITDRTDADAAINDARNNIDPFGVTYLTNNLPYAERREQEGGAPVVGGKGVGGNFIEEELRRVAQNMEAIIANA